MILVKFGIEDLIILAYVFSTVLERIKQFILLFFRIIVLHVVLLNLKGSFTLVDHCSKTPLHIIHSNVWEASHDSIEYFQYYIIFVDDFSRFAWLYSLKHKSEVESIFFTFRKWLKLIWYEN